MESVQGDLTTLAVIIDGLLPQFESGSKSDKECLQRERLHGRACESFWCPYAGAFVLTRAYRCNACEEAFLYYDQCSRLRPPRINEADQALVQALLNASGGVQSAISKPDFMRRSDAARLLQNISDLANTARLNLEELQILVYPKFARKSSARSPRLEAEDPLRKQYVTLGLTKHTNTFQKLSDYIASRDDKPKSALKASRVSFSSLDSKKRLSSSRPESASISAASSPFMPTVEDVEDEDDTRSNAREHGERSGSLFSDEPPDSQVDQNQAPKLGTFMSPPQVVIREATDPAALASMAQPADRMGSPSRNANMTNAGQQVASIKALEEEIARLQQERDRFVTSKLSLPAVVDRTRSRSRHSVDLRAGDDLLHADSSRRHRAFTAAGTERPRSFIEGSSYDPYRSEMPPPPRPDQLKRTVSSRNRKRPSSPKTTAATTSPEPSSPFEPGHRSGIYGPDPRSSLSSGLDGSQSRRRRSNSGRHSKRNSAAFEDAGDNFGNYFGMPEDAFADLALFGGPSKEISKQSESQSRAQSRAKDPSPDSRPYVSPRQLHQSLPLEPDVREITVSMEDLFHGCTKRFRIGRKKYDVRTGLSTKEEHLLEVPISPGLKPGSKVKFDRAGDQTPEGTKELHLQIAERAHPTFTRSDYDLHCVIELTLCEALCGWEKTLTSICGKQVRFSHPGPTPANWLDDRAGLGMCRFDNPNSRGDLIAAVSIRYPGPLSEAQKMLIRRALDSGGSLQEGMI